MKKGYLIGAVLAPLAGLLMWKLLFPQIKGLDGIFIFFLGFFCLWSALACLLGLLSPQSSTGYRWAYAGVFLALFACQLAQVFTDFQATTLVDILLLSTLSILQYGERKKKED